MKRLAAAFENTEPSASKDQQTSATDADPGFSDAIINWQKQHGRHTLPWQNTRDPYRIWLSEIMLQQTQVAAVIPYYQRFLHSFPDVSTLAAAPGEQVMAHWSGLGYYSRARNLHKCAQRIVAEYGAVFPADPALLADLPGIGRSTAAAISAFSFGTRAAILDGNVKRVFARAFGIEGYPGERRIEEHLWRRAVALLPQKNVAAYTQGLMDLGATLCTRSKPSCTRCPLAPRCVALATARTAELPVRKPKKKIPEKYTAMLIVIDQGQVLLQQRPDVGIWGGLLSLPELDGLGVDELRADRLSIDEPGMDGASINAAPGTCDAEQFEMAAMRALAPFGIAASCQRLPLIAHGFTHFKLHIAPFQIKLKRRLAMAAESGHGWYDLARIADAALPAPIKKLLLSIADNG